MENNNDIPTSPSTPISHERPPMGSFTAWYVLLLLVLIAEIIFFSWLTKIFA